MGAIIVVLGIIGLAVLFAYLKFPPSYADAKLVGVFNTMSLGVCALLCFAWVFHTHTYWAGSADDKLWVPISLMGALAVEIVFLLICFLLRNFWIFKPPRRPGSGGWF